MERLLRASEASTLLGINPIHLYRLVREGHLSATKIGKRGVRFTESSLSAWLASQNTVEPTEKTVERVRECLL